MCEGSGRGGGGGEPGEGEREETDVKGEEVLIGEERGGGRSGGSVSAEGAWKEGSEETEGTNDTVGVRVSMETVPSGRRARRSVRGGERKEVMGMTTREEGRISGGTCARGAEGDILHLTKRHQSFGNLGHTHIPT